MSREIKFRIWASNDENPEGRMYYAGDLPIVFNLFGDPIHAPKGYPIEKCCFMRVGWNDIILEQYTGLKDNNGKGLQEVCEGDIISVEGLIRGSIHEIDKRETDLLIPSMGTKEWVNAYKEAVVRGFNFAE